ncbi:MAG: helix-turn-helix transcriptional regulator [Candidatus Nanopelagicales bacterium]
MAETASSRLSRLLAMVPWLQQHPGVSVQQAADHFGVPAADFERDLWLTICCGLPGHGPDQLIDIQFWDEDGAINVLDPQTLDRPLRLSGSEAMSLLVGLRLLAQVPGDHDRSALASVTAKLEEAADVGHGGAAVVHDEVDSDVMKAIGEAIAQERAVHVVYAGATRDEVTERVIEPGQFLHHSGHTYLVGWCREAGAERTFRVDRMRSAQVLDDNSSTRVHRPSPAPSHGESVRLRVAPAARWLLESWDLDDGQEGVDGAIEATITVADRDWLARIALGQGGSVEILEPEDLRIQVRDAARAALVGLTDGHA